MDRFRTNSFGRDEAGAVAIIFALLVTTLFGALALAVDMARAYRADAKISAALDASALAGVKGLDSNHTDNQIETIAKGVFEQAMSKKDAGVTTSNLQVVVDRGNDTVTVKTDANMKTTFARVIGRNDIALNGLTTVKYRIRRVELALSLDVTGSMRWDVDDPSIVNFGKLDAMKKAAKEVIKVMFEEAAADDRVRVSLVPWSSSVNAGPVAGVASQNASVDGCVIERIGANASTDVAPHGSNSVRAFTSPPSDYTCPLSPVTPLLDRSRRSELETAIENLQVDGWTGGHMGTAWGWYTLSPAWADIWPLASRPSNYNPTEVIKSVLIMTDGQFNISWKTVSSMPGNETLMVDESYAQFQALCVAMKEKRVIVYTVGFGLKETRAIDELRTCATSATHFFEASSESDLKKSFKKVADDLKAMRITR